MSSLNKVQLIGRLGRDPEMSKGVCRLSVATSYKPRDGEEKTEWHRVTLFGKLAELAERYLAKGRLVYIEGRLQTSSYEKNGEKRYSTDIVAHELKFLGGKSDGETRERSAPEPYDYAPGADYSADGGDDDIPF